MEWEWSSHLRDDRGSTPRKRSKSPSREHMKVQRAPTITDNVTFSEDAEMLGMSKMLFHQLDYTNDKQLAAEELEGAREVILSSFAQGGEFFKSSPDAFDLRDKVVALLSAIDTDYNGLVDHEEWDNFLQAVYEILGRRRFIEMSSTWAALLHRRFSLPKPVGHALHQAPEDCKDLVGLDVDHIVMDKYSMDMSKKGRRHQHIWSTSRVGKSVESGNPVLIKFYKAGHSGSTHDSFATASFKNQVNVLTELTKPFSEEELESSNGCLATTKASDLFIKLIDFSKDGDGSPCPDPTDGIMYVVTELPKYTLKDYIRDLHQKQDKSGELALSKESFRSLVRSMLFVIAGLHAKGFVHLDLKPENFAVHNNTLKLIDVDGCVRMGNTLSVLDEMLSFSPCYCAPEWAKVVTDELGDVCSLTAGDAIDVWSLGLVICEILVMEPVMGPMYRNFSQHGCSSDEASLLFMEWLGCLDSLPIPGVVREFDAGLPDLLSRNMLVVEPGQRKPLQQCLSHAFFVDSPSVENTFSCTTIAIDAADNMEDHSDYSAHQGALWKLKEGADAADLSQWRLRDMWVTQEGSLCFFSYSSDKRMIYIDASKIHRAVLDDFSGGARSHAFQISIPAEFETEKDDLHIFACNSSKERAGWINALRYAIDKNQHEISGAKPIVLHALHSVTLDVRNRRKTVELAAKEQFQPLYKTWLWKLKTRGDPHNKDDWFFRDMWLSKNGSLVYWSEREERQLIYHTSSEISRCRIEKINNGCTCKPWAFIIHLRSAGDVEIAPSFFAAESYDKREHWMSAFAKFTYLVDAEPEGVHQKYKIRDSTVRDSTIRDSTIRNSTVRDSTIRNYTVRDSTIRNSTVRDSTVRNSTARDSKFRETTSSKFRDTTSSRFRQFGQQHFGK